VIFDIKAAETNQGTKLKFVEAPVDAHKWMKGMWRCEGAMYLNFVCHLCGISHI